MEMKLLHSISPTKHNSNYNTPEEIMATDGPLSFDGVYSNVSDYPEVFEGRDITLFVMGSYVGGNNSFDVSQPYEEYCDWNEIMRLVGGYGCKIGWHTWSHPDLTTLGDAEAIAEITPPFPMEDFGYPYGKWDDRVIQFVKDAGFKRAWSVFDTDGTEWTLPREYV